MLCVSISSCEVIESVNSTDSPPTQLLQSCHRLCGMPFPTFASTCESSCWCKHQTGLAVSASKATWQVIMHSVWTHKRPIYQMRRNCLWLIFQIRSEETYLTVSVTMLENFLHALIFLSVDNHRFIQGLRYVALPSERYSYRCSAVCDEVTSCVWDWD